MAPEAPIADLQTGTRTSRRAAGKRGISLASLRTPAVPAARLDLLLAALLGAGSLLLYLATLAPSVATIFDDSLEFPLVAHRLAIAHPTGYPLYTLLIAAAARLIPLGDVAYRVNLVSAVAGAGAVTLLFLTARRLGLSRPAAVLAAMVFATAETVWTQATIAEVYTLHLLILAALLWAALSWAEPSRAVQGRTRPPASLLVGRRASPDDRQDTELAGARVTASTPSPKPPDPLLSAETATRAKAPLLVAFLFGLGLAHHRMILLWAPALALFVWHSAPWLRWPSSAWLRVAIAAAAPLLLYAYLPLRAATGSLDGSYDNSLSGFLCWISACEYGSFLTENPLAQSRDAAFYLELLLRQLGVVGLALVPVGMLRLGRRPANMLLLAGGGFSVSFALAYRVADPEVFWLPVVLVGALYVGAALDGLAAALRKMSGRSGRREEPLARSSIPPPLLRKLLLALLLVAMLPGWVVRFRAVDRSDAWAAHDLGVDMLAQPLPERATIIGILGEMTLLRYLQETARLRPDIETIAADGEAERLAAADEALARGRRVFLTRPLPGAAERWSLSALGPLIEVHASPVTDLDAGLWPRDDAIGTGIALVGWSVSPVGGKGPPRQRLTVAWQPEEPLAESLKVSPRLLLPSGEVIQGNDAVPVRFAYPTTAWRPGEIILDTYELPLAPGAGYQLILYRAADGVEVGRVELPALDHP